MLDLALPGLSGLELQRVLEQEASLLPIVFLTGRGDIATSVQAMKHGAADFLTKPVDDTRVDRRDPRGAWPGIRRCVARARSASAWRNALQRSPSANGRCSSTIVAGRLNKQIAAELGTVEKTIKFHRANLMRKMGVRVVADLVKLAERAGVGSTPRT